MAGILGKFDTNTNFWDIAGNLTVIPAFSALREADNTRRKEHSSRVMWAVAMLCDQSDSNRLRNLPEEEKKQIIETDFLKAKKKFDWDGRKDLIDVYLRTQLTVNERALFALKEKMHQRTSFLLDTEYTMDNAKDLDSITTNSEKMFRAIASLEKLVEAEKRAGGELKGGRKKGLAEKGGF